MRSAVATSEGTSVRPFTAIVKMASTRPIADTLEDNSVHSAAAKIKGASAWILEMRHHRMMAEARESEARLNMTSARTAEYRLQAFCLLTLRRVYRGFLRGLLTRIYRFI